MFGSIKVREPLQAAILFPGGFPPHPGHWKSLALKESLSVRELGESADALWGLGIEHGRWGRARVFRPRDSSPFPRELYEYCGSLTPTEKKGIADFRVTLMYEAMDRDSVLPGERKKHFRLIREIMGDQAGYMMDGLSLHFWSRAGLDEE